MALDRTNMVSLLDIGSLFGGQTPNIVELGDGFNEIEEDFGPKTQSTQYVNMKTASNSISGYDFAITTSREYLSDSVQAVIDDLTKKFPTGKDLETYYYRFYKSDLTASSGSQTGECIRVPVVVYASSVGGAGGDILATGIEIKGNGDVEQGNISISSDGKFTWAKAS